MTAIWKREIKAYFLSPIGYIFMGFFLLLSGFFFAVYNLLSANPDYTAVLANITTVFLFLIPILTMRLLSEEAGEKTDQLLLTSPLRVVDIVLGKYLAAVTVFLLTLLITCIYPVILTFFGSIAVWEIIGSYIGIFLLGSAFIAVGLFVSSLTDNQLIAAVITFSALLLMWIVDWITRGVPTDRVSGIVFAGIIVVGLAFFVYYSARNLYISIAVVPVGAAVITVVHSVNPSLYDGLIVRFLKWFSLLQRYQEFHMGILSLSPVVYYLSFSLAFLFLTARVIEKKRWS